MVQNMNKVWRKIYNMGLDDFIKFFNKNLGYEGAPRWVEGHFDKMRSNFFSWWMELDDNLQTRMAEDILNA